MGTQAPPVQTVPVPHGVPSVTGVPVSSQLGPASTAHAIANLWHASTGVQSWPAAGQVHRPSTHDQSPAQQSVSPPHAAATGWHPGPATVICGAALGSYAEPELVPALPAQYAYVTLASPEKRVAYAYTPAVAGAVGLIPYS